jgi:type IV pilus assembly protein PilM
MPLSLFKKKSYVGVDLGHHGLKAVQLDRSQSGWKVTRQGCAATPDGCIQDGIVTNVQAAGRALRQLLRDSHIGATSAIASVAGASVVVRTVRIPKMSEAALRKSIRYEAGRYVPNSVEESFVEFEIIGDVDSGQMDVLIVAAPKEIVESRVQACEAAGLEVAVVDIEPFATYRALIEADPSWDWPNTTLALIDLGASRSTVSIISKGVFAMTRSIHLGGTTFTDALKNYFKLSPEEAEAGKAQLDFAALCDDSHPAENPPLRVLQPHADDLIREIRRSINYYQSQQTESGQPNPVTAVVVTGGSAKMPGLTAYMSHKLGVEVKTVGVFDNPRFLYAGADEPGQGLDLAVASGLAMRAYAKVA